MEHHLFISKRASYFRRYVRRLGGQYIKVAYSGPCPSARRQRMPSRNIFGCVTHRQSFFHGEWLNNTAVHIALYGYTAIDLQRIAGAVSVCCFHSLTRRTDKTSCASDFISRLKSGKPPSCRAGNRTTVPKTCAARTHAACRCSHKFSSRNRLHLFLHPHHYSYPSQQGYSLFHL